MIALLLTIVSVTITPALHAPARHHRRCVPPPIVVTVSHPNRPVRIVVPLDPCRHVGPERGN